MKKIDILNFITDFRKSPNDSKTHSQLLSHLGAQNEQQIAELIGELQQTRVLKVTERNGEKTYHVVNGRS